MWHVTDSSALRPKIRTELRKQTPTALQQNTALGLRKTIIERRKEVKSAWKKNSRQEIGQVGQQTPRGRGSGACRAAQGHALQGEPECDQEGASSRPSSWKPAFLPCGSSPAGPAVGDLEGVQQLPPAPFNAEREPGLLHWSWQHREPRSCLGPWVVAAPHQVLSVP